jgi:uncharacterized protein YacL
VKEPLTENSDLTHTRPIEVSSFMARRKVAAVISLLLAVLLGVTVTHLPIQPVFRLILALMTVTVFASAARQLWESS